VAAGALAALIVPIAHPVPAAAAPKPPSIKDLQAQRAKVRSDAARKASELNVLKANDAELSRALQALSNDVTTQQALLEDAEAAAARADEEVAAAEAALEQSEKELAALRGNIRNEAIEQYVSAPRDDEWSVFAGGDPNDALTRRTILQLRSTRSQDSAEQYRSIQEDLARQRQEKEDASRRAKEKRSAVQTRLQSLQASQEQQESVQAQIDDRIDQALAEADALAQSDATLSGEISKRQAELARQLEAARRAAAARNVSGRSTPRPPRGGGGGGGGAGLITDGQGIVNVGGIQVHSSIAGQVASMLEAARADGIVLSGGGYRNPSAQIAVRRNNCGSSHYAIYEAPSSYCRPPTAPPGTSQHERGLAIDFSQNGSTLTRSSSGYAWLKAHAASYGFYNLPSEPWHWSTTGR